MCMESSSSVCVDFSEHVCVCRCGERATVREVHSITAASITALAGWQELGQASLYYAHSNDMQAYAAGAQR